MKGMIAIAAGALAAGVAQAGMQVPQATVEWRSSSASTAGLAAEIERLYLALYNSGNLAVRTVEMPDAPYVEAVLRQEGVIHGSYLPVTIDAMLCDLNPKVCARDRVPVSNRSAVTTHVGGFEPSRGRWSAEAGDPLIIPDYTFSSVTTLARIPAPQGWEPSDFEPSELMDCSDWNLSCAAVVERFNPPIIKAPSGQSSITLPQVQLETTIPLRPDEASRFAEAFGALDQSGDGMPDPREFIDMNAGWSGTWTQELTTQSPNDLALDAIRENLRVVGKATAYSVADEPFVGEQVDLFRLINHPFAELKDLDRSYKRPVGVVVIDSPLSSGHCDLPVLLKADGTEIAPPQPEPADTGPLVADTSGAAIAAEASGPCSEIDGLALSDSDHAVAVAGVIASQENGKGIVGMNPSAQLWMLALDRNQLADQQGRNLVQHLMIGIPNEARVANLSFGVRPTLGHDEIANAMDIQGNRILIVAAAGNEGEELSAAHCPILPACRNDLSNVITVVGLDSELQDPGLWISQSSGTNRHPDFDIGAPAEAVLSTVTEDRFARQTGTSFAAPQVAAAASLIFAAGEFIYGDELGGGQLAPKIVKDRLIYTADFFAGLSGALNAGRLNVGRAINVRDAQFELFDGTRVVGQVVAAPDDFVCRAPLDADRFQSWYNLRRLAWNETRQRHILFRHAGGDVGGRYGELERNPSCLVATLSPTVEVMTVEDGERRLVSFQFRDIRDYTSPLFDE